MAISVIFFALGETRVTTPPRWLPGAKDLLSSLRQHGFRLGVISNTRGLATRADILNVLPTDFDPAAFEALLTLFSSEVRKEKPQKAIFEEAVVRAGKPAGQCVYCSEDIMETLTAQTGGRRTRHLQV